MSEGSAEKTFPGELPSERVNRLKEELHELVKKSSVPRIQFYIHDRMNQFTARLKKQHPECQNYFVYHTLIGSTVEEDDKKDMREGDFEGEYSIEGFYKLLLKDLREGKV